MQNLGVRILLLAFFCLGSVLLATQLTEPKQEYKAQLIEQITDPRDGKTYKILKIDELFWFKENLNYEAPQSECYEGLVENCEKYGRLYSYADAQIACPEGWKLPNVKQWKSLRKSMKSRKAAKIIVPGEWQGEEFADASNELGLSVLPGGRKDEYGSPDRPSQFSQKGISSSYWLDDQAYHWHIRWGKSHIHKHGDISQQGRKFYIRCVCEKLPQ